jgi:hypothetical protein
VKGSIRTSAQRKSGISFLQHAVVCLRTVHFSVDIRYRTAPSDTLFLNNQVGSICKDTALTLFWQYPGSGLEDSKENNTENVGMDLNPRCP